MTNKDNNDINLNKSNNSNMNNHPVQSLKNELNNSDLSDFNDNSIKDSSKDEISNNEPKNASNDENKMDDHANKENSIHLNKNDTSTTDVNSSTCEELHKDRVNIGETTFSKPKKKHTALIIVSILVGLIALLLVGFFILVDNTKLLSSHFDDIDNLRDTYANKDCELNTVGCDDDKTLQTNAVSALFDEMVINNDGTATINVSKSFVYSYLTLDVLNNLDFIKDNDIVINQFGYDLDTQDKNNEYINVYGDITYKGIKAGLKAELYFGFDNDDLIIKFINAKVGNLPTSLYQNYLPKEGTILYQKDISYSVSVGDDISVKIFSPNEIKDISYDENSGIISIVFNYKDALSNINDELFNDEKGSSKFLEILDYYLGVGTDKIDDYISDAQDYLKDNLGIDINDIGDYIKLFSDMAK